MRPVAMCTAMLWLGLVFSACSGSAGNLFLGDAGTDGGNPAGCPFSRPTRGDACSSEGLTCSYGCATSATCDKGAWTISQLGISCPTEAGLSDGPRRLPDGAILCSGSKDCQYPGAPGFSCSPGGRAVGCGACFVPENTCSTDTDCATLDGSVPPKPMVCGPAGPCQCPLGGKTGVCITACQTESDCGPDLACSAGHCVAKSCTSDSECPSTSTVDMACGASGKCAPKPCASDADCGGHYCVDKVCYPQPGICTPPAA